MIPGACFIDSESATEPGSLRSFFPAVILQSCVLLVSTQKEFEIDSTDNCLLVWSWNRQLLIRRVACVIRTCDVYFLLSKLHEVEKIGRSMSHCELKNILWGVQNKEGMSTLLQFCFSRNSLYLFYMMLHLTYEFYNKRI